MLRLTATFGLLILAARSGLAQTDGAVLVVAGTAQRRVPADSAEFEVSWVLQNGEAVAQQKEDAAALDSLRALLRRAGVDVPILRAAGDWYVYNVEEEDRSRRRYAVVHVVGESTIVAVLAGLRNHAIFGDLEPTYWCRCQTELEAEALAEAYERSRRTAEALARASGLRIVGISTMSTQPYHFGPADGFQTVGEHRSRPADGPMAFLRRPDAAAADGGLGAPLVIANATVVVTWRVAGQ